MPNTDLATHLSHSQIYRDYEKAFAAATGLPLTLTPPEDWAVVRQGERRDHPFCSMMAQLSENCENCRKNQEKAGAEGGPDGAREVGCFAGLCDTAVPVRVGQKLVGFLKTEQVALQKPTVGKFRQIAQQLVEWGVHVDLRRLEDAYFHSKVIAPDQYAGVVRLLEIFAIHLGVIGNQLMIQEETTESPFTRRAKAYVAEHQEEPIRLDEVAQALHVSTFYFCKMFKKATGLTFTDYLGRVRIERAKTMLLDPRRRVSEVAYEVGFGSLTQFNRLFRRLVGQSPSDYRESVRLAEPA